MSNRDRVKQEVADLYETGRKLLDSLAEKKKNVGFNMDYQSWYTTALLAVEALAPDRYTEFRGYYEIDSKRKSLGYDTYVIQDYLKDHYAGFDSQKRAAICFMNQLAILNSISARIDSVLSGIEGGLLADFQDNEIASAKELAKFNTRAAGALLGVIIEGHLQKVAANHKVILAKKNPTIGELNDPLKAAGVIDTPAWRKISYLADIRNLCSHKKDTEPTAEQVQDLIRGAEWLTKNVF